MKTKDFALIILLALGFCASIQAEAQELRLAQRTPMPILQHGPLDAVGRIFIVQDLQVVSSCSGALIAKDVVLTAVHCVNRILNEVNTADIFFVPGINAIEISKAPKHLVKRISILQMPRLPENYRASTQGGLISLEEPTAIKDVALLYLKEPVTTISPLELYAGADPDLLANDKKFTAIGYPGSVTQTYLSKGMVPPTAALTDICKIAVFNPAGMMILDCNLEKGMSGGPLLIKENGSYKIVGVASMTATDFAFYVPVNIHRAWIQANLDTK